MASQNGNIDIVKVLIEASGNVNQAETTDGRTPLYIASYYGNLDTVKVLIKAGGNVNQANTTEGCTPLYIASERGRIDTVKVLIEAGCNVNKARTDIGATPLYIASHKGYIDIVKLIIVAGGNVDQVKTSTGASPLYVASQNGYVDIVKVLIDAGGNVNRANNDGVTPLFTAVVTSNVEVVQCLLSIHNIDLKGWKGQSLIAKAKQKNNTEIIQLLTNAQSKAAASNEGETKTPPPKVKATTGDSGRLFNACLDGRLDEVRSLLDLDGIDINCSDKDGCTSLYVG